MSDMNWHTLLSRTRIDKEGHLREPRTDPNRSEFERDWDRILFSSAFRRMHDKTQLFPLPDDDIVHSRLTHSLEVASVGRSLGRAVGRAICGTTPELAPRERDFGDIVAAACLAHDIGNPPFGHAGEDAIADFFRSEGGKRWRDVGVPERAIAELQAFEGNAQGFRILTRLQLEGDGGLQLTTGTLGVFTKYPREAGDDLRDPSQIDCKKYGFFQADKALFSAVARDLGLVGRVGAQGGLGWRRHPLGFLVEAADDICYSILDIEDGVRLGHVPAESAIEALGAIAKASPVYDPARLASFPDRLSAIGYVRAISIGQLTNEVVALFIRNQRALLSGLQQKALVEEVPSGPAPKELTRLTAAKCYSAGSVLEIELAGYEALGGLLRLFVTAILSDTPSKREAKVLDFLTGRGVPREESAYHKLLRVTDFVSGMTDRYALSTYRRLTGMSLPGRG